MSNDSNKKVVEYINETFDDDLENISKARDIYNKLLSEKLQIENQLSFASSEVPGKVETAVREAESCSQKIEGFCVKTEQIAGDIANHHADVTGLGTKLSGLTEQIDQLQDYSSYLQCIGKIEDLSSDIQTAIIIGSIEKAVKQFSTMADLVQTLQSSTCVHLVKFATETLMFWYKILKDRLSSEFEEILTAWRWPFIVSTVKVKPIQNVAEVRSKLPTVFTNLLHLQLPSCLESTDQSRHPLLVNLPEWRPILLPIQLMLKSLKKRFRFHFYGNKQTNSLDKPEWYMTQVLTWIRDHQEFLNSNIQPLLEKAGLAYVHALVEFTRGLVVLVLEKMSNDLPDLLYDDHIFCHFIDEAIAFHKELISQHSYPLNQPTCLTVLTGEECFQKWLKIEKKFAIEKMDLMLSSVTAWESQYKNMTDVDEQKIPECAEAFMTLMLAMTERYKPLPTLQHKVKFVELQLEMLEDYRLRIVQVKTAHADTPLVNNYTAILNTVNYIIEILKQWTDLPFFMELHLYKAKYESTCNLTTSNDEVNKDEEDLEGEGKLSEEDEKPPNTVTSHIETAHISLVEQDIDNLEGTLFDQIIELYEHLRNEMLTNVVHYITDDVKARSRPYRKDKWLLLPSQKDIVSLALSTSACEMLMVLKDLLHQVSLSLSKELFNTSWQRIATELNMFIYKEVILGNHFNDGGAAQIQFDMVRNLFPLFGHYTQKPENYFRDVKEACVLLTVKPGSAMLLKEVLYQALHDPHVDSKLKLTDPIAALQDIGVFKLSPDDAELVLSLRANLGT